MMCPISRAALTANASDRLMTLATPKKDFQLDHPLSCNRYKNRTSINTNKRLNFGRDP